MHGSCHLCSRPLPAPYGSETSLACNYCGADNPVGGCAPGTAPCETCGKVLPIEKPICPDCHAPAGTGLTPDFRAFRFRRRLLGGIWFVRSLLGAVVMLPAMVGAGFDSSALVALDATINFGVMLGLLVAGVLTVRGSVWGISIGLGLTALRAVAFMGALAASASQGSPKGFELLGSILIEILLLLLAVDVLLRRLRTD